MVIEITICGKDIYTSQNNINSIEDIIEFIKSINKNGEFDGDLDTISEFITKKNIDSQKKLNHKEINELCIELSQYTIGDAKGDYGNIDDEDNEDDDTPLHDYCFEY